MNPNNNIPQDVIGFMDKCSGVVGRFEDEMFNQGLFNEINENQIDSPIEQILFCAFMTLLRINFIQRADVHSINGKDIVVGVDLKPQFHIGTYRVDFLASEIMWSKADGT